MEKKDYIEVTIDNYATIFEETKNYKDGFILNIDEFNIRGGLVEEIIISHWKIYYIKYKDTKLNVIGNKNLKFGIKDNIVNIYNIVFKGTVEFYNGGELVIKNSEILCLKSNNNILNNFYLIDSEITTLNIEGKKIDNIEIHNSKIHNNFLSKINFNNIEINNSGLIGPILLKKIEEGAEIKIININFIKGKKEIFIDADKKINQLIIKNKSINNKSINNKNSNIDKIELININISDEGKFKLSNYKIKELYLINNNFLNEYSNINNIEIREIFYVVNVNFGKTFFSGINFNKNISIFMSGIYIINSYFSNMNWENMKLKNNIKVPYIKKDINEIEKKDIYSQFKYSMDKNSNYHDGNYFFIKEMDTLLSKKNKYNVYEFLYRPKYIPILINKIVSEYHNNYLRPLFWILFITLVKIIIQINNKSLEFYVYLDSSFLDIIVNEINPFSNNISDLTFGNFLRKLLIGYLIYSFIVSFKRTSKR